MDTYLFGQDSVTLPHVAFFYNARCICCSHLMRRHFSETVIVACGWLRNPLFFNHADLIHLIKMNRERKECQAALRLLIENKSTNLCVIFKYKLDKRNLLYLLRRCLFAKVLILYAYCESIFISVHPFAFASTLHCYCKFVISFTEVLILVEVCDQHNKGPLQVFLICCIYL